MGKPLMIQPEDEKRIDSLKEKLGARTKVEVVREGLRLLEKETERRDRIARWQRVARLVAEESTKVNLEFQPYSRIKRS